MIRSPSLRTAAGRGVPFSPSPVLAVKLPAWRSKLVMFILFVAFATLAGRAFWLQALTTDFLPKKRRIALCAHARIARNPGQNLGS